MKPYLAKNKEHDCCFLPPNRRNRNYYTLETLGERSSTWFAQAFVEETQRISRSRFTGMITLSPPPPDCNSRIQSASLPSRVYSKFRQHSRALPPFVA